MHLPFACSSALTWVQSGFSSRTRPWFDAHPHRTTTNSAATIAERISLSDFSLACAFYLRGFRYFATASSPTCLPMAVPTSVELR
jgi:hypothetical protein